MVFLRLYFMVSGKVKVFLFCNLSDVRLFLHLSRFTLMFIEFVRVFVFFERCF